MAGRDQRMANRASKTAWGPIVQVAFEQFVPQSQRIIQDALAYQFLPASMRMYVSMGRSGIVRNRLFAIIDSRVPGVRGGIVCRKRYIKEKLVEMLGRDLRALVILGAGMDTLAYRIPELSTLQAFEVDLPEIIEAKKAVLIRLFKKVPEHVKLVPVDFDRQELGMALHEVGYSHESKSFFVWEGVTQYISEAAVGKVFGSLQNTSQGSRLVFTYVRKDFIDGQNMYDLEMLYRLTRQKREFWQFGMHPGEVSDFLEAYGWRELEQVGSAEYQQRYLQPAGRVMPVMAVERCVYAEKL
jgi:methyltransferase (TIGR00027 family)